MKKDKKTDGVLTVGLFDTSYGLSICIENTEKIKEFIQSNPAKYSSEVHIELPDGIHVDMTLDEFIECIKGRNRKHNE